MGFRSFVVSELKATTGRNHATGSEIHIPPSKQANIKPRKLLKDSLNIEG